VPPDLAPEQVRQADAIKEEENVLSDKSKVEAVEIDRESNADRRVTAPARCLIQPVSALSGHLWIIP
jgi:hypothetical protein